MSPIKVKKVKPSSSIRKSTSKSSSSSRSTHTPAKHGTIVLKGKINNKVIN